MNAHELADAINRAAATEQDRVTADQLLTVLNALRFPEVLREFARIVGECQRRACEKPAAAQ